MLNKILCFFRLHPYKIVVKLVPDKTKRGAYAVDVPFSAYDKCKVCGKERNKITGTIQDQERIR